MSLTFRVDTTGYWPLRQKTLSMLGSGTARAVKVALEEGADYARRNHRHTRRTGRLTSSQHLRGELRQADASGAWGYLLNDAPYAAYVEYGTKPHIILPLNYHWGSGGQQRPTSRVTGKRVSGVSAGAGRGSSLRFEMGGRIVFARSVRHPGTRPFAFMQPASTFAGVVIMRETNNVTFPLVASLWG